MSVKNIVDPEWFSSNPTFQVIPDPDPILKLDQVCNVIYKWLQQDFLRILKILWGNNLEKTNWSTQSINLQKIIRILDKKGRIRKEFPDRNPTCQKIPIRFIFSNRIRIHKAVKNPKKLFRIERKHYTVLTIPMRK